MIQLYLSYDEADKAHGDRLKSLIVPLARSVGCVAWSKQDISGGSIWQRVMGERMARSRLFVPLLSADFLASNRCNAELMAALELTKHNRLSIVSVLLRPCWLEDTALLHYPVLPNGEKPVTSWSDRDAAWLRVQSGIVEIVKRMQISKEQL